MNRFDEIAGPIQGTHVPRRLSYSEQPFIPPRGEREKKPSLEHYRPVGKFPHAPDFLVTPQKHHDFLKQYRAAEWERLLDRCADCDYFRQRVFESRSILELPDDWDANGTSAFSQAHLARATGFLFGAVTSIWESERKVLAVPAIQPVSGGSIDIHWKTDDAELLINVPPSDDALAKFYGDNFGKRVIKGMLELSKEDYTLLLWLRLAK